ncbi:MAG: O-antigen ligase family protein [Coriobacteriia bacterium]
MAARGLFWAAIALVSGLVAGIAVVRFGSEVATAAVVAVLGVVAAYAVMRDTRVGLILVLLALPLDVAGRLITQPVVVTVYHAVLLLTLASWARDALRDGIDLRENFSPLHLGAFALLGAALWSLPFSIDPHATQFATIRLFFGVAFFTLFAQYLRDERIFGRVISVLVLTSVASSALAIAQVYIPSLLVVRRHTLGGAGLNYIWRPSALFSDPNYLAGMLSVGIVAAVCKAAYAKDARAALPWLAGALVCSVGLVVTLSRTGWIGVGVGLIVAVITSPSRRRVAFMAVLGIAVALMVAISPGIITNRFESISSDSSSSTRWNMYGSTLEIMRDNWVFGTGLDAYETAYPAYRRLGAARDILRPHELPLSLPAQTGIAGMIAELLIVIGIVHTVIRRRGREWSVWESVSLAGLLALLTQTLFQYYLYFEYLWLFLALTVAAARLSSAAREV